MTDDERAIRTLVDTWMSASKAGDTATVLNLMADDVVFMVPGQEPFGKEAFAAASAGQKGVPVDGTCDIRELQVHGNWAFLRSYLELTITAPGSAQPVQRAGHTLTVLRKERDGRWLLARDANLVTVATFGENMSAHAADNGIVTVPTHRSVEQAADKLASLVEAKQLILFARIDFAADAQRAGLALQPSQLLVFGNPRAGTPLMQAVPTAALDLPLKVLVWQDGDGRVWLSYNATSYLQARHAAPAELMKAIDGIGALVQAAAAD